MRENIVGYLTDLGVTVDDFIIDEVIDRALNYMRIESVPTELERVIARAIYNAHRKFVLDSDGGGQKISSISDHGQSISYSDKATSFMTTLSDEDVLEGITSQLRKFRKVGVVNEDTE